MEKVKQQRKQKVERKYSGLGLQIHSGECDTIAVARNVDLLSDVGTIPITFTY